LIEATGEQAELRRRYRERVRAR